MKRLISFVSIALGLSLLPAGMAQGAAVVVGGPYSGLKAAGDTVRLQFSNFPVNGMYVQQCLITSGVRPTSSQCNPASQVWISTSPGASFKPTDTVSVGVVATFASIDCLVQNCGLFFRLDHTAPGDTSEDRFIPLTFSTSAVPALPLDEISTRVDGNLLARNAVGTLAYRTPITVVSSTKSGAPTSVKVYGESCTSNGPTITALKGAGQCDIAVSSPGTSAYAAVTYHYPVNLTPGKQTFVLNVPSRVVKSRILFAGRAVTNMGEKPWVHIESTKVCAVKTSAVNTVLQAKRTGTCVFTVMALGREGLYESLNSRYTISVKR